MLAKYGDFMKAAKTMQAAIHALLLGDASTIRGNNFRMNIEGINIME
jgi:hypothetical protein